MIIFDLLYRAESPSYPDVDPPSCQLLGPIALVVQALMGLLVILSLMYKRHRETPKRPWKIWLFDVSKQVVGQLYLHGTNLFVSGLVSHHTDGNACVSYFLNILIDTTFGIFLIYVTLHALTNLFTEKFHLKGFESGVYGNPPSIKFWGRQATLYILSLTTMKVVVVSVLTFIPAIYNIGEWLLSWTSTEDGDAVQVIFVMGVFPIMMNVVQFWIIDSIVKASSGVAPFLDIERGEFHDQQPLFEDHSEDGDEGDDDNASIRRPSEPRRRMSVSSTTEGELDDNSLATDLANQDEHKASASSSRIVTDAHSYPPSLSSSFSSDSTPYPSKGPREAKNLQKKVKRRDLSRPLIARSKSGARSPSNVPITPSPKQNEVFIALDGHTWTESWGNVMDWDSETHHKQSTMSSQWNNNVDQTVS